MKRRLSALAVVVSAVFMGTGALAQTVGPDEAIKPNGGVSQNLALTPAQKAAIYNAVVLQRIRITANFPVTVGASVPPLAELRELPDQAVNDPSASFLKYAIVGDKVVVVDPIEMRVVDVIRDGSRP